MIRIHKTGGIHINSEIICDGFDNEASLRIQSHIHSDHLIDFGWSKQSQNILMSKASKDYLGLGKNSMDIAFRPGIIGLEYDRIYEHREYKIKLLNNDHCLGSSQIEITKPTGEKIGYSGDFNYPLEDFIDVDYLVIDGSCGGIHKKRRFSKEDSLEALDKIVNELVRKKPVFIKAHKGLLEKTYFWLSDICPGIPRIASDIFIESIRLHKKYSYSTGFENTIYERNSADAVRIMKSNESFIQFVFHKEHVFNLESKQVITCNRFIEDNSHPLKKIGENSYNLSLSDHADIDGTYEYVRKVNPKVVYIDSSRAPSFCFIQQLSNSIANNCNVKSQILTPI
jgi:putative mRNA 3-end processing factor